MSYNQQPIDIRRDPSMEAIPETFTAAYAGMNASIAAAFTPFSEHIYHSQSAIAETASVALTKAAPGEPREALILGAGNCLDIPLPEIVDSFDRTVLVDVDPNTTEKALSWFNSRELGKISLVGADLTGVMGELGSLLQRASDESADLTTFILTATRAIRGIEPLNRQPNLDREFAFVCSQLLMSQLGSIPFLALSDQVKQKYGERLTLRPGGPDEQLVFALNELNMGVQKDHIRYLSRLVARSGTVHFADTYVQMVGGQPRPMVFDHIIGPIVDEHFIHFSERKAWWWRQPAGRTFGVVAHSLEPRR